MTLTTGILIVLLYSFLGWLTEVVYTFILTGRMVNRGFLHGPLCPIYGIGSLLAIAFVMPFNMNIFVLAITGMISATVLEYTTSVVMEKMFHTTWWDYSKNRFNFQGRVCLQNSVAFGLMCVLIIHVIHPVTMTVMAVIPIEARKTIAGVLLSAVCIDLCVTLYVLSRLDERIAELQAYIQNHLQNIEEHRWFDPFCLSKSYVRLSAMKCDEADELYSLRKKSLEMMLKKSQGMNRIFTTFPALKNHRHNFSLGAFRYSVRKEK